MYSKISVLRAKNFIKFLSFVVFLLSVMYTHRVWAAIDGTQSRDAIAVRILNNSNHYSPMHWYEEQGYVGSPARLKVDGYEAIRDGRTVYVAASNTDGINLYTNIYLISHNDLADSNTINIFEKLLKNWKFNGNLMGSGDVGVCVNLETKIADGKNCYADDDCVYSSYCDSVKADVVRDTKRHADLTDLARMIEEYHIDNGIYPTMNAGSYLKNRTISTWPSWKNNFASEIEVKNSDEMPIDPYNNIGDCGETRFNPTTCWDEEVKDYAGGNDYDYFNLPAISSRVYLYRGHESGLNYKLCANFDTTFSLYPASSGYGTCIGVDEFIINTAPIFTSQERLLNAHLGENYIAYVSAFDANGDALNWRISDEGNFIGQIEISQTVSSYHKRIQITSTGINNAGVDSHEIGLQINDGYGWTTEEIFTINVFN